MATAKARKWTIIVVVLISLLFVSFFLLRTFILAKVLERARISLHNKLNINLTIGSYNFKQFRSIYFKNITLTDSLQQPIFHTDSVYVQLRVLPLFAGKIRFNKFYSKNLNININNLLIDRVLQLRSHSKTTDTISQINYAKTLDNVFKALFSFVPGEVQMDSSFFRYNRYKMKLTVSCGSFQVANNNFSGNIFLSDSLNQSDLQLTGFINASNHNFNISGYSNTTEHITLPYINQRWGLTVKFDTLSFSFNLLDDSWSNMKFAGYAHAANFEIQNKRIAPNPVLVKNGNLDFIFNAGERYIELDSSSIVSANSFSFSPYVKFENQNGRAMTIDIVLGEGFHTPSSLAAITINS